METLRISIFTGFMIYGLVVMLLQYTSKGERVIAFHERWSPVMVILSMIIILISLVIDGKFLERG